MLQYVCHVFLPYHRLWCRWNIGKLTLKFFRGNENIFTFYVIPPHWHDTGSWNSSLNKARTYLFHMVNIMGADVLATQGARASATMIFTKFNRINLVPAHQGLTHWSLGDFNETLGKCFSSLFYWLMAVVSLVKLPSSEYHWTLVVISKHWFRSWLGAIRQQAITWTNIDPDLCHHMVSLLTRSQWINSLGHVGYGMPHKICFRWMWMPQYSTDNEPTLAQMMARCHQATSHDLN